MLCQFLLYSKSDSVLFPYRSLQSMEQISLCYTVGLYWIVYLCCVLVQLLSQVLLFGTPWTTAGQVPLSLTVSRRSLLYFMSIELVIFLYINNNVHMSVPTSQFILPPHLFPSLETISLFSTSVTLFLFCKKVNLYFFFLRFHI